MFNPKKSDKTDSAKSASEEEEDEEDLLAAAAAENFNSGKIYNIHVYIRPIIYYAVCS
jgi:hypothetical protein